MIPDYLEVYTQVLIHQCQCACWMAYSEGPFDEAGHLDLT